MFIPRMHGVVKYPTIFITGCFYRIGEYFFMFAFMKPATFRVRFTLLLFLPFFRRRSRVILVILVIVIF